MFHHISELTWRIQQKIPHAVFLTNLEVFVNEGHWIVFLCKTLYSHCSSFQPGV